MAFALTPRLGDQDRFLILAKIMGDHPVKRLAQRGRGTALLKIENVLKHPLGWTIQELRGLARRE